MLSLLLTSFLASFATASPLPSASSSPRWNSDGQYDVLILGGGVAGIIAAEQLHKAGIENYLIVEARDELGGRMHSYKLDNYTVEVGCNWVQGTQTGKGYVVTRGSKYRPRADDRSYLLKGNGPINPIYSLALKHKLVTTTNNWEDLQFYDENGHANFSEAVSERRWLSSLPC